MKCKNHDILMDLGLQYPTAVWYIQLSTPARQDQKKFPIDKKQQNRYYGFTAFNKNRQNPTKDGS
jgi:hypothetical protein